MERGVCKGANSMNEISDVDCYEVSCGETKVEVDLPLSVSYADGIRITTRCDTEVAMWSQDEVENPIVKRVALDAARKARREPRQLLDEMAHHVVGVDDD